MSSPKIQGLTADVEVLTQVEGWKSIASVGETEKIATKPFGAPDGSIQYVVPSQWVQTVITEQSPLSLATIRHNRVELRCSLDTRLVAKLTKTAPYTLMEARQLNGIDFYMKNYLGEVVVKPINFTVSFNSFIGTIYIPVTVNTNFMVRKNGKISWVCCDATAV